MTEYNKPAYLVAGDGDSALQIFFTEKEAFADGNLYLDVFNARGKRINSLKRVGWDTETDTAKYTEDF